MESLSSRKKTGLIILGLGAAAAAIWYATSDANAATLPDSSQPDLPSGATPSYPMPSDSTRSYDPNAAVTNYPNAYTQALPAYSPTPSATRGDATVQLYQQRLSELGYDPGPIDGLYGSFTRRAVMDFQRDHGLTVDGILGPRTKASIDGSTGTPAPVSGLGRSGFWRAAGSASSRAPMRPSATSGISRGRRAGRWRC